MAALRSLTAWINGAPPPRSASKRLRSPVASPTTALGDARFMTLDEAQEAFPGPTKAYGGLVIGEAYEPQHDSVSDLPFDPENRDTWGQGGKTRLLITDCRKGSTHSIITAGSGYYKSQSLAASMFTWTGPVIVLDPSEEIAAMVASVRRRMGHRVFILSLETSKTVGFNALDWIDVKSPLAEVHIISIVEWVCGYTPHHDQTAQFFKDSGKSLLTCFLADMMFCTDLDDEVKTLKKFREAITVPETEMRKRLRRVAEMSESSFARELAEDLCETVEETFSGLRRNALEDTKWLSIPAFADLVSGNSFRTSDICDGRTDIFISIGLQALTDVKGVGRTIIGSLTNAAYEAKGKIWGAPGQSRRGRIYVAIDEAWVLGNMSILMTLAVAGRKYRVTLQLIYQSRAQMEYQWGALGATTWESVATWRSYAGIYETEIAERLSNEIGDYGVLVSTETVNTGWQGRFAMTSRSRGQSRSWQETRRRRMTKEEILYNMRDDEQLLFSAHGPPLRSGRAIAFRRPEMVKLMGDNPFNSDAMPEFDPLTGEVRNG